MQMNVLVCMGEVHQDETQIFYFFPVSTICSITICHFHYKKGISQEKSYMFLCVKKDDIFQITAMTLDFLGIPSLSESVMSLLETLDDGKPITTRSVAELLFQGYESVIDAIWLHLLAENPPFFHDMINDTFQNLLPPEMSDGKFGYYRVSSGNTYNLDSICST